MADTWICRPIDLIDRARGPGKRGEFEVPVCRGAIVD
jgi:hypothetical protein